MHGSTMKFWKVHALFDLRSSVRRISDWLNWGRVLCCNVPVWSESSKSGGGPAIGRYSASGAIEHFNMKINVNYI